MVNICLRRGAPIVHPENRAVGMGEAISRSNRARQTPGHLSCSDLERAQNSGPTESVPLRSTRQPEPELLDLGSAYNSGPASDSSQQSNLETKQCRQRKSTRREWGQTQCGQDNGSTPHRPQCYFFAAFLPPHSTTEQGSLKKVSTTAPLSQGGN